MKEFKNLILILFAVFIGLNYFGDGPVAEFKEEDGRTFRLDESSLKERIMNLKKYSMNTDQERMALKYLLDAKENKGE